MSESEVNWIKLQNTKVIDLDLKSCTIDKNEQSIFQEESVDSRKNLSPRSDFEEYTYKSTVWDNAEGR